MLSATQTSAVTPNNMSGINFFNAELVAKRLDLLRELVPGASRVAVLVNPSNLASGERTEREAEAAARAMGLQIQILNASQHQAARSMRPLRRLCASGPRPSSSVPTDFSTAGAFNWQPWRRATRFP